MSDIYDVDNKVFRFRVKFSPIFSSKNLFKKRRTNLFFKGPYPLTSDLTPTQGLRKGSVMSILDETLLVSFDFFCTIDRFVRICLETFQFFLNPPYVLNNLGRPLVSS